jgi:hypothetical protein
MPHVMIKMYHETSEELKVKDKYRLPCEIFKTLEWEIKLTINNNY